MTISSAYDDFCARTLSALAGAWQRLQYLAQLRAPDGRYQHWGLARTFGDHAAQRALAQAHSELFLEILRTPLRRLDGEYSAEEAAQWSSYLPENAEGGSPEHFSSVVSALAALSAARRPSPTPGA
ncbi:MAG TPA: hypothetical protein VMS96_13220 [Terriglobales bacterium]|nr:hypothetical protein [Terriglobales bacterium]